jgi:hypothetical protein
MTTSGQPDRGVFGPWHDFQGGHVGTLAAIFDAHAAHLFDYCRTLLSDPEEAVGATQATLIMASALIGHLHDRSQLRPWLVTLARRECLSANPARTELARAGMPRSAGPASEHSLASPPLAVWQGSVRVLLDPDLRPCRDAVVARAGRLQPDGFPEMASGSARSRLKLTRLMAVAVPAAAVVAIVLYFAYAVGSPRPHQRPASSSTAQSPAAGPSKVASAGLRPSSRQVTVLLFPGHQTGIFLPVLAASTPPSVLHKPRPKPSRAVRTSSPAGMSSPPSEAPSPSASPAPSPSRSPTPMPTISGPPTKSPTKSPAG